MLNSHHSILGFLLFIELSNQVIWRVLLSNLPLSSVGSTLCFQYLVECFDVLSLLLSDHLHYMSIVFLEPLELHQITDLPLEPPQLLTMSEDPPHFVSL